MRVEYDSLGPPIISTEDAVRANSYVENYKPVVIQVGDASGESAGSRASGGRCVGQSICLSSNVPIRCSGIGSSVTTLRCISRMQFFWIFKADVIMMLLLLLVAAFSKSDHVISGQVAVGYQYHFHLETHACLCVPTEDGYTVYSSTQWTANVQTAVAGILGITNNRYCPLIER